MAITGRTVSPGIFESVALLGREETLRRIDARWKARERGSRAPLRNYPSIVGPSDADTASNTESPARMAGEPKEGV